MPQDLHLPITRHIESSARALPYTAVGVVLSTPESSGTYHVLRVGLPIGMDSPAPTGDVPGSQVYQIDPSLYADMFAGGAPVSLSSVRVVEAIISPMAGVSPANVEKGDFVVMYSFGHAQSYWYVSSVIKKDTQREVISMVRNTQSVPAVSP